VIHPPATPKPSTAALWQQIGKGLEQKRCAALERAANTLLATKPSADEQARAHMFVAECRLRTNDRRAALAHFSEVARRFGETDSGDAAALEQAKLETQLNGPRRGLAAVERYLREHPRGAFREPASFSRCGLLITLGEIEQASQCLTTYREHYRDSANSTEVVLLNATIARVRERWAEASASYREYLATPKPIHEEEARYWLVVTLERQASPEAERERATYLERFPQGPHAERLRQVQRSAPP
jgi:hypothetical protein